jgi:hypothetical protein
MLMMAVSGESKLLSCCKEFSNGFKLIVLTLHFSCATSTCMLESKRTSDQNNEDEGHKKKVVGVCDGWLLHGGSTE